ncbi:MAG: hypothetical protein PHF00_03150 [Elusimicrobia bacterium]|nr:hypothetical protein [Elusimicrobiota bacterium]
MWYCLSLARLAYWNLWPLARLLMVLAALGLWVHRGVGASPRALHLCGEISGGLTILLIVCALLSLPLARLYVLTLLFPLYAVVVLNCLFYDGPRLMMRQLVGRAPRCVEAAFGLAGEIGLFMSLARMAYSLLMMFCPV